MPGRLTRSTPRKPDWGTFLPVYRKPRPANMSRKEWRRFQAMVAAAKRALTGEDDAGTGV